MANVMPGQSLTLEQRRENAENAIEAAQQKVNKQLTLNATPPSFIDRITNRRSKNLMASQEKLAEAKLEEAEIEVQAAQALLDKAPLRERLATQKKLAEAKVKAALAKIQAIEAKQAVKNTPTIGWELENAKKEWKDALKHQEDLQNYEPQQPRTEEEHAELKKLDIAKRNYVGASIAHGESLNPNMTPEEKNRQIKMAVLKTAQFPWPSDFKSGEDLQPIKDATQELNTMSEQLKTPAQPAGSSMDLSAAMQKLNVQADKQAQRMPGQDSKPNAPQSPLLPLLSRQAPLPEVSQKTDVTPQQSASQPGVALQQEVSTTSHKLK